jgi:NADH-quinone oxidoreductase subunit J
MLSVHLILFLAFGAIALAGAVNLLVQRHPINSALSLIAVMAALAGEYLLLGAEFVAAVQVIVYAGAIMVLFVFVIMLLNAGIEQKAPRRLWVRYAGLPMLACFVGIAFYLIQRVLPPTAGVRFGAFTHGNAAEIGLKLFEDYLLPFEVTSILILVALIGAIVLARKEIN